jgi:hypothetical protein
MVIRGPQLTGWHRPRISEASFIDSTVAHAVERARKALAERGTPVALVIPRSA